MLFTSPVFVLFFALVFAACRAGLPWTARKAILLAASIAFYAAWNPPFVALLLGSVALDYGVGLLLARTQAAGRRKALLVASLAGNLGVLAVFKYANFFSENFLAAAHAMGWQLQLMPWNIVLPVGISFYTFQTLSYTIDLYRRKLEPERNLLDFALFVTFFPQLVAGPIVRASEFLPQLKAPRQATGNQIGWGAILFVLGLFKKVWLADQIFAPAVNAGFSLPSAPSFLDAWFSVWAFAGQVYCDFSGYSDMAIGLALALGFTLPDNFHAPFGSIGFTDHWRRWHMSLSSWLRDCLYISLGGNRKGRLRTYLNLTLTMLLGGLWHGANWTYVAWGGLNGVYLSLERRFQIAWLSGLLHRSRLARAVAIVLTFQGACVGYAFFRARDMGQALGFLRSMFGMGQALFTTEVSRRLTLTSTLAIAALVLVHGLMRQRKWEDVSARAGWLATAAVAGVMLALVLTSGGGGNAFIYFQF